jgi:hypothetical protein
MMLREGLEKFFHQKYYMKDIGKISEIKKSALPSPKAEDLKGPRA